MSKLGTNSGISISTTSVPVAHRSIVIESTFETFTSALEDILGRFSPEVQHDVISAPQVAEQRIRAMEGEQGLMIFFVLDHGAALNILGARRKAKQYLIGNPLTAIQATRHDLRASLYAPLRVIAYEKTAGETIVEFDQPSTLFGQFGNPDVAAVGLSLDAKLEAVIRRAAEPLRQE
jgi:uncharacterized protein (DUF302 family)